MPPAHAGGIFSVNTPAALRYTESESILRERISMMRQNGEKIAIYSRKSKFTGKGESIGNQVDLCREYVRSTFGNAWADRCVIFEDEGFSGGNINRPAFQRMMEKIEKNDSRQY